MNKKVLGLIIFVILLLVVGGIIFAVTLNNNNTNQSNNLNESVQRNGQNTAINQTNSSVASLNETQNNNVTNNESSRVKMTVNNNEIYITLNDSQASKDFVAMLPLTLECEDYNSTEKIASLPNELSTEGSPTGYTPEIGDFAYYAPWENLSIFYKEFRYSNSLIKLGTFESGIEEISSLNNNFTATFELVNN